MTQANFTSSYQAIFLAAIAKAANVSVSKVSILNTIPRRALGSQQEELITHFKVHEPLQFHMQHVQQSLRAHRVHISWGEAYEVHVQSSRRDPYMDWY